MIRTLAAFAVVLVAFPLLAVTPSSEITIESVLANVNACRVEAGMPPLALNDRLNEAADDRMRDMLELEYWNHVAPDGRSPFLFVHSRGYQFAYAAENLATGFETAELMVTGWMESKGHRENMLSPLYTECGIAVIDGSTVRRSVGRSVVILFARPQSPLPAVPTRKAVRVLETEQARVKEIPAHRFTSSMSDIAGSNP
jgi:hypothetical protein